MCYGDSGGPLVQYDEFGDLWQIGVTAFVVPPCGTELTVSGYVGIRYFREWIDSVIGGIATNSLEE